MVVAEAERGGERTLKETRTKELRALANLASPFTSTAYLTCEVRRKGTGSEGRGDEIGDGERAAKESRRPTAARARRGPEPSAVTSEACCEGSARTPCGRTASPCTQTQGTLGAASDRARPREDRQRLLPGAREWQALSKHWRGADGAKRLPTEGDA